MVPEPAGLVGAHQGRRVTTYLITGAGGQLGTDLLDQVSAAGHSSIGLTRADLDFDMSGTDIANALHRFVADLRPDVIVNCAAWTGVDACESDPDRADRINGHAVASLAEVCAAESIRLVQISTDYVFDGELDRPYDVDDRTGPINAYGTSKLIGEQAMDPLHEGGLVVRTSWVFSGHGGNMVATIARLADQGVPLRFVDDQVGCPTFTPDLADAIVALVEVGAEGTVHVTNSGPTTWYGFAREVVGLLGRDPNEVSPISSADLQPPRPARRPVNSVLDGRSLTAAGVPARRDFREALATLLG